ncbi:MAG: acyl-CoA dehydrogenase family protein [Pseudomonadota bacterium]
MDDIESLEQRVRDFVRAEVIPFEQDPRRDAHGPTDDLVTDLRARARAAGVLTPHIRADGTHLSHRDTARILIASGHSPLGPLACNTAAPDEGNMFLLGHVASDEQKARFLAPLIRGEARSAFFMTEPADIGGAGSDPSMLKTEARADGNHWVISGQKTFITGAEGARVGLIMAMTEAGATLFLTDLPDPAIRIDRVLDTLDGSMPGGHSRITIDNLRLPASHILGAPGDGFRLAQVRLAPARLTHCMRWTGLALRAQDIATDYACTRHSFGKPLIDHEGVGFALAQNQIDLQVCSMMIDWCADALDRGEQANVESSMAKVEVSERLFQIADRCVQAMGGTGITDDTIVATLFRETRAFRIYDGPTEVHKWSLAKKIKRAHAERSA